MSTPVEEIVVSLRPSTERAATAERGDPPGLARLLERARRGEAAAFEQLFEAYKDYVYSVARYLIDDDELAADAVQEVFLKLLHKLGRFRGDSRFTTWLYRVVHNTVHDLLRRRRPEVPLSELAGTSVVGTPVAPGRIGRRESAQQVRRAVALLSPKLREVVVLRYVCELSYEEIASALCVTRGTVASRLHRAHERIAALVPREEVEVP